MNDKSDLQTVFEHAQSLGFTLTQSTSWARLYVGGKFVAAASDCCGLVAGVAQRLRAGETMDALIANALDENLYVG